MEMLIISFLKSCISEKCLNADLRKVGGRKHSSVVQRNSQNPCGLHFFIKFCCNKMKWQFWVSSQSSLSSQSLRINNWVTVEKFEYLYHFWRQHYVGGKIGMVFKILQSWYQILFFSVCSDFDTLHSWYWVKRWMYSSLIDMEIKHQPKANITNLKYLIHDYRFCS